MALKISDLEEFHRDLFNDNVFLCLDRAALEAKIAEKFGISDYVIKNITKKMVQFGFLKEDRPGFFCNWKADKIAGHIKDVATT